MIGKEELISIFEDTKSLYETDPVLKESVRASAIVRRFFEYKRYSS